MPPQLLQADPFFVLFQQPEDGPARLPADGALLEGQVQKFLLFRGGGGLPAGGQQPQQVPLGQTGERSQTLYQLVQRFAGLPGRGRCPRAWGGEFLPQLLQLFHDLGGGLLPHALNRQQRLHGGVGQVRRSAHAHAVQAVVRPDGQAQLPQRNVRQTGKWRVLRGLRVL